MEIADKDLVSKKELLELTGISYGQLYRWKRERLLPEEWFIKRSSYTGQETFFPRTAILERVDAIKQLKEELSLEAIADLFSPQATDTVSADELENLLDVDAEYAKLVIECFAQSLDTNAADISLGFSEVVFISALGSLVKKGTLEAPQAAHLAFESRDLAAQWINETISCEVLAVSGDATANNPSPTSWHLILCKETSLPLFSQGVKIAATLPLQETATAIKQILKKRL